MPFVNIILPIYNHSNTLSLTTFGNEILAPLLIKIFIMLQNEFTVIVS